MPSISIPAPVSGLNDRDSIDLMTPDFALSLVNMVPESGKLRLRRGYATHASGMTPTVQSLFEYNAQNGTSQLIACGGGKIWNATTAGVATSLGSGFVVNYWQAINFGNKLVLVNGTDQPQQWDGTTLSNAVYTGVTDNDLIHLTSYKNRLYFVEKDSSSVWYGAVDAITGALTEFDVSSIFTRGGYIMWAKSWSRDKGEGVNNVFVICSSEGEILVYGGDYPGDANWGLLGHFYQAPPIGRRSALSIDGDLIILTEQGLLSLSSVLQDKETNVTDTIKNTFADAATNYKANQGWEIFHYQAARLLIVNVPITSTGLSKQYVMNIITGAWAEFSNIHSYAWSLLNGLAYFGTSSGLVNKFDTGYNDNGSSIPWDIKFSYNYLRSRENIKQITMVKPLLSIGGEATIDVDVDVDFITRTSNASSSISINTTGSLWNVAKWNTSKWATTSGYLEQWFAVAGIGRAFSLRFTGNFKNLPFSLYSTQVIFTRGGFI